MAECFLFFFHSSYFPVAHVGESHCRVYLSNITIPILFLFLLLLLLLPLSHLRRSSFHPLFFSPSFFFSPSSPPVSATYRSCVRACVHRNAFCLLWIYGALWHSWIYSFASPLPPSVSSTPKHSVLQGSVRSFARLRRRQCACRTKPKKATH